MPRNLEVGEYSSINRGFTCETRQNTHIRIGKFCSIGPNCTLLTANHPIARPASSKVFWYWIFGDYDETHLGGIYHEEADVVIGNDVWIGTSVIVLPGVSIGDGAVIGAGSVVTNDVPEYAIFAGNPAGHIRYRFEEPVREFLLKVKWWDWDERKIKENVEFFLADLTQLTPEEIKRLVK